MGYPIWDLAMGGGVLMAVVAITHVIVSHFAIGGGLLLAWSETVAVRRDDEALRQLAKRSSLMLILISTVFGAISGVGIWVVAGLVAPATISALIRNYVWGWAIEWVFFIVEILAALIYYTTWEKISRRVHVMIGWVYFVAAYLSLVVINGIITFMLTPGAWLETGAFWDGFFNPTYWPSLVLRTGISLLMAVAFMVWAARRSAAEDRPRLARYLGLWAVAGVAASYLGYRWWEASLSEGIRTLFLGDSPVLVTLAQTRSFLLAALALTLAVTLVFYLARPRWARALPALLLTLSAFAFFGGYERLREGVRKPYLIHDHMFSNGIRIDQVATLRQEGILPRAGWAALEEGQERVHPGRALFRLQCAACHTLDGYQAIRPLLPEDADMIYSVLFTLYDQAEPFLEPTEGEIDKASLAYPHMPPFVGTEEEMELLVEYLATLSAAPEPAPATGGLQ